MKITAGILLAVPVLLTSVVAQTLGPAPQCTSDSCYRRVQKNIRNGHKGCVRYHPVTRTPKPTTTTVTKGRGVTTVTVHTTKTKTKTKKITVPTSITVDTTTVTTTTTIVGGGGGGGGGRVGGRDAAPVTAAHVEARDAAPLTAANLEARAATLKPLPVPPFARSNCKNYNQFSSACRCLGHTRTLKTAPRSTSTTTVRVNRATSTKTVTDKAKTTTTKTQFSTVRVTATSTKTVTADPENTACNTNRYLEVAFFTNPYTDDSDPPYPEFDPTPLKTQTPESNGGTTFIYDGDSTGQTTIYGYTFQAPFTVLQHRGYILAPTTGTYTIANRGSDDLTLFWLGPKAYSGYTRDNAFWESDTPGGPGDKTFDLVAGTYTPIRILYANAQQGLGWHFRVNGPDGTQFIGPDTMASPYLIWESCDGVSAPPYAAWGNES